MRQVSESFAFTLFVQWFVQFAQRFAQCGQRFAQWQCATKVSRLFCTKIAFIEAISLTFHCLIPKSDQLISTLEARVLIAKRSASMLK
ncbi:MAG: hypothetical protein COC17_05085 [Hyphomicrobiales bacterium]|nr:MAG: hypothetical protein COC17_06595 [Hyphomicrobiales bacterium]PCH50485.1 MAG: hypothetical protein COC17_05085 [Hyphomicrobiales bacterium]